MPRYHRFPAEVLRHARVDLAAVYGADDTARRVAVAMAGMRNNPSPSPAQPVPSAVLTPAQRQARATARAQGRDEVLQIAQACNEAGAADRLAGFLRAGLSLDQVSAALAAGDTAPASSAEAVISRALAGIDPDEFWASALDKARSGGSIR